MDGQMVEVPLIAGTMLTILACNTTTTLTDIHAVINHELGDI
jgi:hypothetical protein